TSVNCFKLSRTSESLLGVVAGLTFCANSIPSKPNRARTRTIRKSERKLERRELPAMFRHPRAGTSRAPATPSDASITCESASLSWMQTGAGGYGGARFLGGCGSREFRGPEENPKLDQWRGIPPGTTNVQGGHPVLVEFSRSLLEVVAWLCGDRLRLLLSHIRLGLQPILWIAAIGSPAFFVQFVGATADLLLNLTGRFGWWWGCRCRSGYGECAFHGEVTPLWA